MDEIEMAGMDDGVEPLKLRHAWLIWFCCLAIWIGLFVLASVTLKFFANVAFVFYIVAGFYLNKKVLPRLIEWHPVFNTLDNVSMEKLKLFIAWPLTYGLLLSKLSINKIL